MLPPVLLPPPNKLDVWDCPEPSAGLLGVANPPKAPLLLFVPPKAFPPVEALLPNKDDGCAGFVIEPNRDGCEAPEVGANPPKGPEEEVVAGLLAPPNMLLVWLLLVAAPDPKILLAEGLLFEEG